MLHQWYGFFLKNNDKALWISRLLVLAHTIPFLLASACQDAPISGPS